MGFSLREQTRASSTKEYCQEIEKLIPERKEAILKKLRNEPDGLSAPDLEDVGWAPRLLDRSAKIILAIHIALEDLVKEGKIRKLAGLYYLNND